MDHDGLAGCEPGRFAGCFDPNFEVQIIPGVSSLIPSNLSDFLSGLIITFTSLGPFANWSSRFW